MLNYRELAPSPAFAGRIECFWTMHLEGAPAVHRVVPDGCSDILLTVDPGAPARLELVGPMTTWRDHSIQPGREMFGARFRPGHAPLPPIPDSLYPLEDRRLLDRLANTTAPHDRARIVEAILPPESPDPLLRAIAHLGRIPVDDLARQANLSPRQFRRRCEALTGYAPKLLARILRFRRASAILAQGSPAVSTALDCGYCDQSHLIRDYRLLAGATPSASRGI
jgi:AraC-like DNA-binding protein